MAYVQTKGCGGVSRVYLHPAGCKVTKKHYIYNLKGVIMNTKSTDNMKRKDKTILIAIATALAVMAVLLTLANLIG